MQQVMSNNEGKTARVEKDKEDEDKGDDSSSIDTAFALKTYLNRIPISSLPHITKSPVVEIKAGDSVRDAMQLLYEKNANVALICDMSQNNSSNNTTTATIVKPSDKYIGVIHFSTMVLWCFERLQTEGSHQSQKKAENQPSQGFFSVLQQNPHINQTKVGELAKSFLWNPFFPVHLEDDTLFHVLLLLSKHRLNVVPVIDRSKHQVIGFITENAVVKFLLESSGLEWFDNITNTNLSQFRCKRINGVYQVYAEQSISEAFLVLFENRIGAVAVIDQNTKELLGTVKDSDINLLLDNDKLFANVNTISIAEVMNMKSNKHGLKGLGESQERQPCSATSARFCVGNNLNMRMDSLIVHKESNTLKQVMEKMAETNDESSFLVDESWRVIGMISLRDIIAEFAPPCVDSGVGGGGFFESALQQTGCHIENGTMVSNH